MDGESEQGLGRVDVCLNGSDRIIRHQLNTDGGRHVVDLVDPRDNICERDGVGDGCLPKTEAWM